MKSPMFINDLPIVKVTEEAAIAAAQLKGLGDEKKADQVAVDAMRKALNELPISGTVVIGEGERDEAPMLYIGEQVGRGGDPVDIALDPLEGTTLTAQARAGALAVIAIAPKGTLLHAPDTYMKKIAVGPEGRGVIHLSQTPTWNLEKLAAAKGVGISDLTVMILDRPRHKELIEEVRSAGSRVALIQDGDVAAALLTCIPGSGVDLLLGIGGAPEGVLAAAALKCLRGDFQGRLHLRNEEEGKRAEKMGISPRQTFSLEKLVRGDVVVSLTGVTDGTILSGVEFLGEHRVKTHSLVLKSYDKSYQEIITERSRQYA